MKNYSPVGSQKKLGSKKGSVGPKKFKIPELSNDGSLIQIEDVDATKDDMIEKSSVKIKVNK